MKSKWKKLHPNVQRLSVVISALAAVGLVVTLIPEKDSSHNQTRTNQDVIRHVLTDRDTRTVGLDSLSASLKTMQSKSASQDRLIQKLERDLELAKKQSREPSSLVKGQMEDLRRQIRKLEQGVEEAKSSNSVGVATLAVEPGTGSDMEIDEDGNPIITDDESSYRTSFVDGASVEFDDLTQRNPLDVFQGERLPTSVMESRSGARSSSQRTAPKINVVMEHKERAQDRQEQKQSDDTFYMPAGSIITGVLLNGMDAPTGQGARQDPFPVTMRVQKEAILPNRFRADIRECFIVVAGYGDLSSERAYLRGETISCVREDGAVVEAKLNSYAVGEDGKAGMRGRLVSKQGQVIARSLMAGFMSGLSKAFDVKPVAVLDTSNSGSTNYQRNNPNSDWLRSSAASGASSALDRVADFYMKMAEGMFPVIEVDAGRQVDLIVSSGAQMRFKNVGGNS